MATYTQRIGGIRSELGFKAPVRTCSTSNITLAGFQTVGGEVLADGDENLRVLVTGQTDAKQNGIYDAQSGNWTRALDFDGNGDFTNGTRIYVQEGNNSGEWIVTSFSPHIIGTSSITFSRATTVTDIPRVTRTEMKDLYPFTTNAAYLTESGREGMFTFKSGNYAALVTADTLEGVYIGSGVVATTSGAWVREQASEHLNILWFGADATGTADARAAWDAVTKTNFRRIVIPAGVYTSSTGFPLVSAAGLTIEGAGWANTTLQRSTDGNVIEITDSQYVTFEGFYFGRKTGPTYTSGNGLVTYGTSANVECTLCRSNEHPGSGFLWFGTVGSQQSEHALFRCEAISNAYAGVQGVYANDFTISECGLGDPIAGWNSDFGAELTHCDQGSYVGNRHWGHQIGASFNYCTALRYVAGNRAEESSFEGVVFTSCLLPLVNGNVFHSNGQISVNSHPHLKLDTCTYAQVIGNSSMSWNTGSYKVNYFLLTAGTCTVTAIGNECQDFASAKYSFSAGTTRTVIDSEAVYLMASGDTTETMDERVNPSTTSWASINADYWVGSLGSPRVREIRQAAGAGNGGQFLKQLTDSAGTLWTRHQITQDGHHSFAAAATFTGATAATAESFNATITRNSAGNYTLTATTGTLPTNSHVFAGGVSANPLAHSITARSTTAITVAFQALSAGVWAAADPTTVWIQVL